MATFHAYEAANFPLAKGVLDPCNDYIRRQKNCQLRFLRNFESRKPCADVTNSKVSGLASTIRWMTSICFQVLRMASLYWVEQETQADQNY